MTSRTQKQPSALDVQKTRARFLRLYTDAVYDILDDMKLPNQCLDLGIRPLGQSMKIAGPAFTLCGGPEVRREDEFDESDYNKHSFFRDIYPGCVMVVSASNDRNAGHSGELNATAAIYQGATGMVVDGAIRDGAKLLALNDFPVFVRYTSMIEARGRYRNRMHQRPIAMSGTLSSQVRVDPGDWIFGDIDGVLVIPVDVVPAVLDKAERMGVIEDEIRNDLRAGGDIAKVIGKFGRL